MGTNLPMAINYALIVYLAIVLLDPLKDHVDLMDSGADLNHDVTKQIAEPTLLVQMENSLQSTTPMAITTTNTVDGRLPYALTERL